MRVLLVGDTHGNQRWLQGTVFPTAAREDVDLIVQIGDFGWWPGNAGGDAFLEAARRSAVPVWWIDGNHEHHDQLAALVEASGQLGSDDLVSGVELGGNLTYLPRGARFTLDGVTVAVCGGAHSIDRQLRNPGRSWFEAERISDADVARCAAGGAADILISHDAPAGWTIPNIISDGDLPPRLAAELASCASHRAQLARIFDALTPALVVHGHYHSAYTTVIDTPWGSVDVVGLGCDGTAGNVALLNCDAGEWSVTSLRVPA